MEICKKKFFNIFLIFFLYFIFTNTNYAEINFKNLENKKVSYIDFFLLKFENRLSRQSNLLRSQMFATRVQYSGINIQVNFDKKNNKVNSKIYAVMDRNRYSKKKYKAKISDCNQIRNLMLYNKHGYKFFTQKRDPALSQDLMEEIFKEIYFENINFTEEEINFLVDNMFIKVTIFHPINKREISCSGKINQYELN